MTLATFAINGKPLEDYGLGVSKADGWLSLPRRVYTTAQIPSRDGARALSAGSMSEARALGLRLYFSPTDLADRRTKLNALFAALQGSLEVSTIEDSNKVCYGFLESAPVAPPGREMLAGIPQLYADLQVTCFDPLWYDRLFRVAAVSTINTAVAIPVGSATGRRLVITINGPASAPVVIMRNSAGTELQRMSFAGLTGGSALVAGDVLEIDCDAFTVTRFASSWAGGVNTLSALGSSETFFAAVPALAPTLEFTAGTGYVTAWRAFYS